MKDIKRQTSHFTEVIGDSFTAIPYKVYANISEESSSKKRNTHLSDEIFKHTDNNISARRNAIKKQLDYYKKQSLLEQVDYDNFISELSHVATGMSDIDYRRVSGGKNDPFKDIITKIGHKLPHEKLGRTIKNHVTQSDIGLYDDFYNVQKDMSNALLAQVSDFKELLDGSYVKKRINKMGGQSKSVKTLDITSQFKNAMSTLEKMGIGTHIERTADGLKFGLFDAKNTKDVLSNVNGKVVADWGKMAKYTFGMPGDSGDVKINGMQFADQFRTIALKTPTGSGVGMTTVSQQMLSQFFEAIQSQAGKPDGLFGKIKNNDYHAASQEIGRFMMDIINGAYGANKYIDSKGASSNAVYRDLPNLAKEIMQDSHAGSTEVQRMLRSNRINLSEQLRQQFAETFDLKVQDVTGQDLERMMNYIYAHIASPEAVKILKSNNEYKDLFSKGSTFLNPTVDVLKQVAPHLGISSLKEANYLFGELAGVDTSVLNPFNPLTSGSYRGVAQGANHVKAATKRSAKGLFSEAIMRSDFMEGLNQDFYKQAENKVLNMAEINDKMVAESKANGGDGSDEDALTYAMFPNVAPKFFAERAKGPVDAATAFAKKEAPAAAKGKKK